MEQVSRNSQFIFPPAKREATFQEGYEHWFDFSRILLPAHGFCCEQDRQRSSLEVGVCPPLIPAVQTVERSQSCWTENPRKRRRTTTEGEEEQENHANNQDKDPKDERIKRERKEESEFNSAKRKLILKLVQDREISEDKDWKKGKAVNDVKEVSSSVNEENKTPQENLESDNKLSKTKLEEYLEKRRKNNASAKKSREARRMRELQTQIHAAYLENENSKLRTIVGALRKENTHLRELLIG